MQHARLGSYLVMVGMLSACEGPPLGPPPPSAQPPGAIVGATPTGDSYENVALMVGRLDERSPWGPVCSGTLVAPDIVLTAAHCIALAPLFDGYTEFGVSFAPHFSPSAPVIRVTESPVHPRFVLSFPFPTPDKPIDLFDVGLLILEKEVDLIPARLPPPGLLDNLMPALAPLTIVGFGIPRADADAAERGTRRAGAARIDRVFDGVFSTEPAPAAACFGDSGGPALLGPATSHGGRKTVGMIVGITQSSDCATFTMHYRLDTPQAQEFLGAFLNRAQDIAPPSSDGRHR